MSFDAFGTLFEGRGIEAVGGFATAVMDHATATLASGIQGQLDGCVWPELAGDAYRLWLMEQLRSRAQDAGLIGDVGQVAAMQAYEALITPGAMRAHAAAVLAKLKSAGHIVTVCSNAPPEAESRFRSALLPIPVDEIVVSGNVGVAKPHPAIFAAAHHDIDVHVGDSLLHDVLGAMASGRRAVWLCSRSQLPDGAQLLDRYSDRLLAVTADITDVVQVIENLAAGCG